MVLIKDIEDDDVALEKAEAMRAEVTKVNHKIGMEVSLSIGIAIYDKDGKTFEELYRAADKALYQVKKKGKNGVALFSAADETAPDAASKSAAADE
jgi:diguanylate cyclase (GGDEF)-like protein